jgi:hypothetical protein
MGGLKGLMYVTADGSTGITVIVCAAGSPDSDMPLTVMPVFPVDPVLVWVGVVGEEESPPQPATVPTTSSIATTSIAHRFIFSTEAGYRKRREDVTCTPSPSSGTEEAGEVSAENPLLRL